MPVDYKHIDYDLGIADGDFVKADTTQQHKNLLFVTSKGEWRQYPKVGINAIAFLLDDEAADMYPEIVEQFKADGLIIRGLKVYGDGRVEESCYYP